MPEVLQMNIQATALPVNDSDNAFSPRIAIYGIGFVGSLLTRLIVQKGWPIVAAFNRPGEKIGQDLGKLAGLDQELGILVQDYEKADYSTLQADVVLIAGPDYLDQAYPIYERFLKAGINIISYGSHAYEPYMFHPDLAEKIEQLAQEHGVTFTGSGLWDMTRIWSGMIAAGPCVKIDSVEYSTDTEALRQGLHWIEPMGIGLSLDEWNKKMGRQVGQLNHVLQIPARIIMQYYGYTVTNVDMYQEAVVFDETVYCEYQKKAMPAGVCVGNRTVVDVQTKEGVTAHSKFEYRLFKPGEIEHSTWKIKGQPSMEVRVVREDSDVAQASSALNRIPDVLAARPGIVPIMELGPLKPSALL